MTSPLAQDFRAVMAGVATPVSVVTTLTDGHPHGTTVSAFASLSMARPMGHVIVLGEVHRAATTDAAPLTYRARTFGTHARVA